MVWSEIKLWPFSCHKLTLFLKYPLEEAGYVLEIPFEEMAIMKMGTISLTMIPIQEKRFVSRIALWGCLWQS